MLTSMTGFGSKEAEAALFGKISVELRSTNHKFLETVLHLPEGFLSLEDRLKKIIEAKIKRGRVVCAINLNGNKASRVFIDDKLLKNYLVGIKNVKHKFHLSGEISLDKLIQLPGVLSLAQSSIPKERIWPSLRALAVQAVDNLVKMRKKEGQVLYRHLKRRQDSLKKELGIVKNRFKEVLQSKISKIKAPEERSSFLKNSDINEEIERLAFHIKNFGHKLTQSGAVGKELDFIAQEMQREANTMGAKSCDSLLSARVVQIKSQVEKIREQVQNIE